MNIFVKTPGIVKRYFTRFTWHLPTEAKRIYLTFDDGPIPETTPWILSVLKKFEAKATFFCVGDNVSKYPELFESIISDGHSVGNHTFNHLNGWKTDTESYIDNIEKADKLINSNLFRPPYGKIRNTAKTLLLEKYKLIMWDILSRDFDPDISKEVCLSNVMKHACPGSIVIFHDSKKSFPHLSFVLPVVLESLYEKGYEFAAIEYQSTPKY